MQISFKNDKPTLYLVSTPIGNLEDITFRAVNTLKEVAVIFAEDTRVTKRLLEHYQIETLVSSYHEHEKHDKAKVILEKLSRGLSVALVSDAGTPGISDPGFELVNYVIENDFNVVSIPGPSASITALVSSGLLIEPHFFIGFLPRKKTELANKLKELKNIEATLIFYESPFRVSQTINQMQNIFGNRKVVLARELTKIFETYLRTTLDEAVKIEHNTKGEYVILVEGFKKSKSKKSVKELYAEFIEAGYNEKEAFKLVSEELNISRREVYQEIKID